MKIIRWIVVSSFTFFIMAGVYGQNNQIGVIGGINIASLKMEKTNIDIQNLIGMGIGGVLDFRFSESISWRFEPMYLLKGVKATATEDTATMKQKLKFQYIEIPLFLKIAFGSSYIQPYVMAGASIGVLLSANAEIHETGSDTQIDIKDVINGIEYSAGFGGGISLSLGKYALFVEGRYTIGVLNLFQNTSTIQINGKEGQITYVQPKNKGIQIFTGISIYLGN